MKKKIDKNDLKYMKKIEDAIIKKYGLRALNNPKEEWSEKDEKEYLQQIKKIYKNKTKKEVEHEIEVSEGFLIEKRLLEKENDRNCPVCKKYSYKMRDDIFMIKYKCCEECYIRNIEGREEKK